MRLPLQPDTMFNPLNNDSMGYYDEETYDEYNGTYVQDFDCHFGYHSEFSVHLFTFLVHVFCPPSS